MLLSAAAARPYGAVLPAPASLKTRGAALAQSLGALLRRGLVEERPAATRDSAWRHDGDRPLGLAITRAGLAALGLGPSEGSAGAAADTRAATAPSPACPRGKLGTLVRMMSTGDGAARAELGESVGWQPHTVRAALTRLRQRGFDLHRATAGGRTVYRLGAAG